MRIREVISSLTALQLNEGPGDVNPAAQNTKAKAKVQGSSKRADIGKRDLKQKEAERGDKIRSAGDVSSAGEGDEELARLKADLESEDEREARQARFDADAAKSRRAGTLNPNAGFTNPDALSGAEARADDIGEFGRSGEKRVKDNLRLKNQENRPGHQGGLDAAQKGGDPKHDNSEEEMEKAKDASEKERIYQADEVEQMIRSDSPLEQQIGTGMLRHNAKVAGTGQGDEELAQHADAIRRGAPAQIPTKPKKAGQEMSAMGAEAQAKIDAQKKAAKANLVPMSDKAQAAADLKKDVRARNKEGYDDLEHEEKEIAAQTGAARTAREVDQLKRAAKEDDVHLSKEQRIQIGNTRREQGPEAAEKLKQQFLGAGDGELYNTPVKELSDDQVNQLALNAKGGSERDTEMLYKRLGLYLMQLAWRHNFKDREALPDVFGEAKAAMLQALDRYEEGKGNFTTWMRRNVEGLLKNYAYGDRNVAMDKNMGAKISQLNKISQQVAHDGLEGMDADLAIIEKMGLKSWDEYDKLKQYAATMNTQSADAPVSDDEDAPTVGATSDSSVGMQSSFHGDQSEYDMDKQVADLLFYGGEADPEQTIDALYDRGGIEDDERMIMNKLMGIGGEAPQSVSQLAAETGLKGYAIKKAVTAAMQGMAQAIARENKTNADEELANLEKIFKTRERDHKEANIARADSFSHDEMQDPEIGDFVRGEEEKRNVIRTAKASQAKRDAKKKGVSESAGDWMRDMLNACDV